MVIAVTPRAWALLTSARISAEPTPRPCQPSATTTPMSAVAPPARAAGGSTVGALRWHGHGVPDDHTVPDRDKHLGPGRPAAAAGQPAEHRPGRDHRGEEPQQPGPGGKPGEELAQRRVVGGGHPPDGDAVTAGGRHPRPYGRHGRRPLGSVHRLSIARDC
jgi:hypothetical protein